MHWNTFSPKSALEASLGDGAAGVAGSLEAVYEDAVAGAKLGDGDGGTPWPDEADGLSVLEHHADVGLLKCERRERQVVESRRVHAALDGDDARCATGGGRRGGVGGW